MRSRNLTSLLFASISLIGNIFLVYSINPKSFLFGYHNSVLVIAVACFTSAIIALYFGIPYFDEETNAKHPMTAPLFFGLLLGSLNLIIVIVITPAIFIFWGGPAPIEMLGDFLTQLFQNLLV